MDKPTVNVQTMSWNALLGILFVGLKLTGYIDWSWWWVTAPFWAPWGIVLAITIAILALYATIAIAGMIGGAILAKRNRG